jgi:hypothetical protein
MAGIFEGLYFIAPAIDGKLIHGKVMRHDGDFLLTSDFIGEPPVLSPSWFSHCGHAPIDNNWIFHENEAAHFAVWESFPDDATPQPLKVIDLKNHKRQTTPDSAPK